MSQSMSSVAHGKRKERFSQNSTPALSNDRRAKKLVGPHEGTSSPSSQPLLSSDYDIAADYSHVFDDTYAAAMDDAVALYHNQGPKGVSPTLSPVAVQPSSPLVEQVVRPTPPTIPPEIIGFPEGSPCQPVNFGDDTCVLVPIVRNDKGKPVDFIHKHLQRLANSAKVEHFPNYAPIRNLIGRLSVGNPVVIKNPFGPEGQFGMEFLVLNYQISSLTPVDIHDCLTDKTERTYLSEFFSITRNQTKKCAIRMLPVTSTRYFSGLVEQLDQCFGIAWGICVPYGLETRDKPLQVDHLRHNLQLFHWGYHQFSMRAPEGLSCCMKVLVGTIALVISDIGNLVQHYKGRAAIFEHWHKSNIKFSAGPHSFDKYLTSSLCTVILKAADTIILPPGTFYELYAASDAVVATNYFYMLETLHLTEFSRRYDALFIPPKQDLHRFAYLSLSRLICNLSFAGACINLNPLLSLCSMVINPAYYTHPSSNAREQSRRIQAAGWRYLSINDPLLEPKSLENSMKAHTIHPVIPPSPLLVEQNRFPSFSYPLQHDLEWALECARLIEKSLYKNSQQFTIHVDGQGRTVYNGVDFAAVLNYQWNPLVQQLHTELKTFFQKRRFKFMKSILDTRDSIITDSISP